MITKTVRQWTYEDVRLALSSYFHTEVSGIRHCGENGYFAEECLRPQQGFSAPQVQAAHFSTPDMQTASTITRYCRTILA